jgi:hypothetical protein
MVNKRGKKTSSTPDQSASLTGRQRNITASDGTPPLFRRCLLQCSSVPEASLSVAATDQVVTRADTREREDK